MEKSVKTEFNYSAEFKIRVILDMLDNGLNIHEVVNIKLLKVCQEREIAWITVLWKTSSED